MTANIPDSAVEAAAEAFRQAFWANDTPNDGTMCNGITHRCRTCAPAQHRQG